MKICHITTVHQRSDTRIFQKECVSLAKEHEVTFAVSDGKENEYKNNVRIVDFGKTKWFFFGRLIKGIRILIYVRKNKFDVCHFHDPEFVFISWIILNKMSNLIYDIHEDYSEQIISKKWLPFLIREPFARMFYFMEKVMLNNFFLGAVTSTDYIRVKFSKNTTNKNIVAVKNYSFINNNFSNREKSNKYLVCYAGGINTERGIINVVKALRIIKSEIKNVKFGLAGLFHESKLESLLKEEYFDIVDSKGYLSAQGVQTLYANSEIGIVCLQPIKRFQDSLPIKMFEYMSAGVPVIASNFPLWKDIIEKNNCGICVDPLNINEIVQAILKIKNNPIMARQMGENGRKAVESTYNWEREEVKLSNFYNKIQVIVNK